MERVVVVGSGIAGVSVARELARRGVRVTVVFDPSRPPTTPVAAGMLAPAGETDFGEELLVGLERDALAHWRALASHLAGLGHEILFEERGTLIAAQTTGDLDHLRRLAQLQTRLGIAAELLGREELRAREPALSSHLAGGLWLADDAQVDNRRALAALRTEAHALGVAFRELAVRTTSARAVTGIGGERIEADAVVLAAGAWMGTLSPAVVQPVRGTTIRGTVSVALAPRHCVRGELRGRRVYVVPRASGEVVIGATVEEAPLEDRLPRARDLIDLLEDARTVLPGLGELAITDVSVGFRPGTTDNLPLVGELPDGRWVHGGHYRHGILLAPYTASLLADAMLGRPADPRLVHLSPTRQREVA